MLNSEEKRYIRKSLIENLKYLRYLVYVMLIVCIFIEVFGFIPKYLKENDILGAITSIFGLLYPILFFGGFYLFFEIITGNQIFKFLTGNYTVSKEILHSKYSISTTVTRKIGYRYNDVYNYYCDTQDNTRLLFSNTDSYRNAEIGSIVIILSFGKNKNNKLAFALPKKVY